MISDSIYKYTGSNISLSNLYELINQALEKHANSIVHLDLKIGVSFQHDFLLSKLTIDIIQNTKGNLWKIKIRLADCKGAKEYNRNDGIENYILSRVSDETKAICNNRYYGPSFGDKDLHLTSSLTVY
ncbi:hypothetical protein RhiirA4_481587 [Rhizophagus irregularis]|uniref:Uncharacterized protein n=1 Tax=Rhizophagus irregularis TaxID=588596 RepID=A0A2I1HJQ4_9GLOM|nr:hypothetical protein RhiirA4_481587 [Rhizophagus irregularis]